jgi:hypothetical protein
LGTSGEEKPADAQHWMKVISAFKRANMLSIEGMEK